MREDIIIPDNYRVRARGIEHDFYISKEIGAPEDYIDLLDCLFKAGPEDTITIHINTPGGRLDTVVQINHAIQCTQAFVVTSAEGDVASGGSLLFFSGHGFMVSDHSLFLLHDAHGGFAGKGSDNIKTAMALNKQVASLYNAVYTPFFGEEVVDKVLNGSEEYFLGSEVKDVLGEYMKRQEEQQEGEQND